jgi:hypothetical protein
MKIYEKNEKFCINLKTYEKLKKNIKKIKF